MDQTMSNIYTNETSPSSDLITTTTTGDNAIMKQVLDTHDHPEGTDIDANPLVNMVEEFLRHVETNAAIDKDVTSALAHTDMVKLEAKSRQTNMVLMLNVFSRVIRTLAHEMSFKSITVRDGHTTTLALFHMVGNYHWDAKLPVILAAFTLNYGELIRLLAQIYSPNQLEKPMVHSVSLKPRFDALNRLIHLVLELTRCISQFTKLQSRYDAKYEIPALKRALSTIPIAVYWNVRGIIAFAAQITSLTSMGYEYGISSTEMQSWELSSFILKINHLIEFHRKQLEDYQRFIEERKEEDFKNSFNQLFEKVHIDNMKVLKILLNLRDDPLPLFDGAAKRRVGLEVLRKRSVLLLISGLDMSSDELSILLQIYSESRIRGSRLDDLYEQVWVPVVDTYVEHADTMQAQFEDLKKIMPWYSANHPSNIDQAVKKCIQERWHFRNKPILVVLDPQGRELSKNALHMMWIWGSNAFPFTIPREEELWKDETWRLELLVGGMDPNILNWIWQEKYIFLYGGDDIEWIHKFAKNARAMAIAARIPLEMAYVGKRKKVENVRRAMATIIVERLSYCWQETALIWFFWVRLESMLFSKTQLKGADDQDLIMLEIKKLFSYDKDGSWAMLCRGSDILTTGHGSNMMQTLADFDLWKADIPSRGFDSSFKDYHDKLDITTSNCSRFEFPIAGGQLPERMRCPECHRLMQEDIYCAYVCCHGKRE